jgi:heat-inducible transcriptional repressor
MTWNYMHDDLTERERRVLEAVILCYVETAEPAGSRTIAKKYNLGVSAATIRNTMSDLEDRGYLYHPHTSAGRMPTDRAYRVYVDKLMAHSNVTAQEQDRLIRELGTDETGIESLLQKAAQVLGILTHELGVAVAPSFDEAVLEQLQLMNVSSDRILMVLLLTGGAARTIFVEVGSTFPREALDKLASVLNERLAGLSLREVRLTLRERLRDALDGGRELLNVFVEEADNIFQMPEREDGSVLLSSAQMLAEQPEFSSKRQMRTLLDLTEQRDLLRKALRERNEPGITVTIGGENLDPKLSTFTIVTSTYESGSLSGVIGVMGPTRMPYRKVMSLVEHTSRLMSHLAPISSS